MYKKIFKNFLIILIFLVFASNLFADEISIQSPLPTFPSFVKKGDELKIEVVADKKANKFFTVGLTTGYFKILLSVVSKNYNPDKKLWEISAKVPENAPTELYNLVIVSNKGADTKERAVKVIDNYKDSFSFVHLTDIHCGDKKTEENFQKVIEEVNLINPEFVLITGDSMDECENLCRLLMYRAGEKVSNIRTEIYENLSDEEIKGACIKEYKTFLGLLSKLKVPSFVIPGNHDMVGIYNKPCREIYEKMIGKRYYSFDYGNIHFIGCDNSNMMETAELLYYDANNKDIDEEQLKWLEEDLKNAQDKKLRIAFFHVPINTGNSKFKELLKKYNVDMGLYGHMHSNFVLRKTKPIWVMTSSVGKSEIDISGYRIIKIKGGEILSFTYAGDKKAGLPINKLNYEFIPENNGKNYEVKCIIKNELNEDFQDALIRFVMPKDKNYEVIGGKLKQEVKGNEFKILYVVLDIPKLQETNVIVKKKK